MLISCPLFEIIWAAHSAEPSLGKTLFFVLQLIFTCFYSIRWAQFNTLFLWWLNFLYKHEFTKNRNLQPGKTRLTIHSKLKKLSHRELPAWLHSDRLILRKILRSELMNSLVQISYHLMLYHINISFNLYDTCIIFAINRMQE